MLEAESLPNPVLKKSRKSSSKLGERIIQNLPTTLHKIVIKMAKEVPYAPGALLPKHCNNVEATSISYSDLTTASQAVLTGLIKPEDFRRAQQRDSHCRDIRKHILKGGAPKFFNQ